MNNNDLETGIFGYPLLTYAWVILLSSIAGVVKYINSGGTFSWRYAIRDVITAAFTGLITFWVCEYYSVTGPLQAVCIAVFAVMGNRAWVILEEIVKMRLQAAATVATGVAAAPQVQNKDAPSTSEAGVTKGEQP